MTTVDEVLAGYERLLQRSARMLSWARDGDWTNLVQEESVYVVAVEELKRLEAGCQLDHAEASRKADLLERILEQDAELHRRLRSRRDELSELIGNSRRRRDVSRAYQDENASVVSITQGHQ